MFYHAILETTVFWLAVCVALRMVTLHKASATMRMDFIYLIVWAVMYALGTAAHLLLEKMSVSSELFLPGGWLAAKTLSASMLLFVAYRPIGISVRVIPLLVGLTTAVVFFGLALQGGDAHSYGIFGRPQELFPILLLMAVLFIERHGDPVGKAIHGFAWISIISHAVMLGSTALYDAYFVAAHIVAAIAFVPVIWWVWWIPTRS